MATGAVARLEMCYRIRILPEAFGGVGRLPTPLTQPLLGREGTDRQPRKEGVTMGNPTLTGPPRGTACSTVTEEDRKGGAGTGM